MYIHILNDIFIRGVTLWIRSLSLRFSKDEIYFAMCHIRLRDPLSTILFPRQSTILSHPLSLFPSLSNYGVRILPVVVWVSSLDDCFYRFNHWCSNKIPSFVLICSFVTVLTLIFWRLLFYPIPFELWVCNILIIIQF